MKTYFVYLCIYITFYILGGYSTTDILRLLSGSTLSINYPYCCCPVCNAKIKLTAQLPVFAYLKNKGQCYNCKSKIPISELLMELLVCIPMCLIATIFHFSWCSYWLCVLYYELFKCGLLIYKGKRETDFFKNLIFSLANNLILFLILAFFFALAHVAP